MGILEDLQGCGLDLTDAAEGAALEVGEQVATVTAKDAGQKLELSASLLLQLQPEPDLLRTVGLAAPGDSTLEWGDGVLQARRTLAEPSLGVAYDAVFELAKAAVAFAQSVDALSDRGISQPEPSASSRSGDEEVTSDRAGPSPTPSSLDPLGPSFSVRASTPLQTKDLAVIGDLEPGHRYPILSEAQGWVRTRTLEGIEGWVAADRVDRLP